MVDKHLTINELIKQNQTLQAQVAEMREVLEGLEVAATKVNKERLKPSANLFVWCVKARSLITSTPAGEWLAIKKSELRMLLREFDEESESFTTLATSNLPAEETPEPEKEEEPFTSGGGDFGGGGASGSWGSEEGDN